VPLLGAVPRHLRDAAATRAPVVEPDHTLRIGTGLVELAPGRIVSTTLYNGQFPGPLLRFKEGSPTVVDVHNDTDTPSWRTIRATRSSTATSSCTWISGS
jgi:FtsP/CotA-like multicopper oxidase with cupredoxin domain